MHAVSALWGKSDASVMAQIMSVVPQLEKGLTREELQKFSAGAARNALDCALWDLAARRQQQSLADLIGITLPRQLSLHRRLSSVRLIRWPIVHQHSGRQARNY